MKPQKSAKSKYLQKPEMPWKNQDLPLITLKKLKKELNAKVTKTQKIKAQHDPKAIHKITTTGIIEYVKGEDGPESIRRRV